MALIKINGLLLFQSTTSDVQTAPLVMYHSKTSSIHSGVFINTSLQSNWSSRKPKKTSTNCYWLANRISPVTLCFKMISAHNNLFLDIQYMYRFVIQNWLPYKNWMKRRQALWMERVLKSRIQTKWLNSISASFRSARRPSWRQSTFFSSGSLFQSSTLE